MSKTNLIKSIDEMIDDIFSENVSKASDLDVASLASTTADAVVDKAPKAQKDDARGAGRPKQISDVPDMDEDGKRAGKYDDDIVEEKSGEDQPEASQVKMAGQDKGKQESGKPDGAPFGKAISQEEYEEFLEFKKSQKKQKKQKELRKALEEQRDLIKSAVKEATSGIIKENSELKKSLSETQELVKAMAERPQRRKSIDGIQALEKSQTEGTEEKNFSKSEMLDVAEELVMKKSMTFRDEHLIELENTGFIYDRAARETLETALKNKK